jgi:pimeloyl-ACP methyl ester carboxylesterase
MTTVEANGVALGVERFGEAAAPLVLLAGGTTMLSWPDALCEALARRGRHVVRYDLRDSGASTTVDPEAPADTCATSQMTPQRSPVNSTTGRRIWRASASAGWSPRSLRSTTPRRSRRSP